MADTELVEWSLPAETKEWVGPLTVTLDGVPQTSYEVQVQLAAARPVIGAWAAPTVLEGEGGVLVGVGTSFPLVPLKKYTVWVRYTAAPEIPVVRAGTIRAT